MDVAGHAVQAASDHDTHRDASASFAAATGDPVFGAAGRDAGPSEPPDHCRGFPRQLLHRALKPPASPGTRARNPFLELIAVPRLAAIQATEDALSMAHLALVLGTRPPVTPAMMLHRLQEHYEIDGDHVSFRRTHPDDFIVRFSRQEDLDRVLGSLEPHGASFVLRWRRWHRNITESAGSFRSRTLVGMKGIPAHACLVEVVQQLLGSSGAKVDIADPDAADDPDDECELFVAVWCAHPDLIPDEKILAILEPEEEHDAGPPLFLRPWEIIHSELSTLQYLVPMRLVEF